MIESRAASPGEVTVARVRSFGPLGPETCLAHVCVVGLVQHRLLADLRPTEASA
jgi:hypothetical protein